MLFVALALLIADTLDASLFDHSFDPAGNDSGPIDTLVTLVTLPPSLAVGARRQLLWFIPVLGWGFLIYWLASDSDPRPNQYGPSPESAFAEPAYPATQYGQFQQSGQMPPQYGQMAQPGSHVAPPAPGQAPQQPGYQAPPAPGHYCQTPPPPGPYTGQ